VNLSSISAAAQEQRDEQYGGTAEDWAAA